MQKRLGVWWNRVLREAKDRWWYWILMLPLAMIQNRFVDWANHQVDAQSAKICKTMIEALKVANNGPFGVIGYVFLMVVLGLVVHAYIDTRKIRTASSSIQTTRENELEHENEIYLSAYETIHYMADESQWGHYQKIGVSDAFMRKQPLIEAIGEFRKAATAGKVSILGRYNGKGEHRPMSSHYWLSAGLNMEVILRPPYQCSETMATDGQGIPIYTELKILAEDVYYTWPH